MSNIIKGGSKGPLTISQTSDKPIMTLPLKFHKTYLPKIIKEDIKPNGVAFVLYNVFSKEQCKWINEYFDKSSYKHVSEAGYRRDYRDNFRVIVDSPDLAKFMLERIRPFIEEELNINNEKQDLLERGFPPNQTTFGKWKLDALNTRYRLCKYIPGGLFKPHYDGDYVANSEHRSFKTCMLYTNGDFKGGTTNFIDEKTKEIYYSIKPVPGMVLVFNHHLFHEGQQITSGEKYIVRTDIMYRRVSGAVFDDVMANALEHLELAYQAEGAGEYKKAVEHYKTAYKLCPELE